uniref:Inositol hexakisphosphate and diphosphoinositol-pentakisphosphate kinase n=2 Tax=Grammatophora oceanica TaxID=210454 RepID=A0A7S1UZH4_9STRA
MKHPQMTDPASADSVEPPLVEGEKLVPIKLGDGEGDLLKTRDKAEGVIFTLPKSVDTTPSSSVHGFGSTEQAAVLASVTAQPQMPAEKPKLSKKKSQVPFIKAAVADEELENCPTGRIRLGICAMDKKARSKPMAEILSRLDENLFRVIFFGDQLILDAPVSEWPVVDVLVAFHSKGYPLEKAREYASLNKPFVLNDLAMQEDIKDRRAVYDLLEASGIDVPRHVYLSRDGYGSKGTGAGNGANEQEVNEFDDHIEVNGVVINKPFVEKPVDADDHNITIYYPSSAGGGCKKLFRKIGNRSSEFYPDVSEVRRDGSYIYEAFLETQGTDVKMYTVGPEYGHAEARKSPTVDGKVERDPDGKEIRFPVILTLREKEIARRIVLGFKQFVCGFDLLRVQEGDQLVSYVCDVNGFSFVKNSRKYYDDCSQVLSEHILAAIRPNMLRCFSTLDPLVTTALNLQDAFRNKEPSAFQRVTRMLTGHQPETADLGVIEGGDGPASPSRSEATVEMASYPNNGGATTLEDGAVPVREIPDVLTSEPASMGSSCASSQGDRAEASKLRGDSLPGSHEEELRCVIAVVRHGDRTPKQKLKVNTTEPRILEYFHKHAASCKKDLKVKAKAPMKEFLDTVKIMIKEKEEGRGTSGDFSEHTILYKLLHMRDVLERWKISGLNRKLQIKPRKTEECSDQNGETTLRCTEVQLILKWGGNLTKLGEKQSIHLGQRLRHDLYPDAPGGGILRLHSTFRHDLKIKTSDEGRVMKTAAAFAKGLLELEGEIPPILVSLVHKEKDSLHMLDPSGNKEVKAELDECKDRINKNLQRDIDYEKATEEEREAIVGPSDLTSLHNAFKNVGNPRMTLFRIYNTIGELVSQLEEMLGSMASGDENVNEGGEGLKGECDSYQALSGVKLYKGETLLELTERWRFIHHRLYDEETGLFDLSRVPEVHDHSRFDMLHNPHLGLSSTLGKLYELAKVMADCVVPQEYGTTIAEKRSIGSKMCGALLDKIKYDLIIARTDNRTDMRYMINMEYGSDLPINSMGRRIRTRLYFTSESHLHTMLNVLRFGGVDGQTSFLSDDGKALIHDTPELCYLTQVVLRLFEDTSCVSDNPARYRVELLFSPGATATPMHMAELERDSDSSRFETDRLRTISREGLTCEEVEAFLTTCISAGTVEDDDQYDNLSMSTMTDDWKRKNKLPIVKSSNKAFSPPRTDSRKGVVDAKQTETGSSDVIAGVGYTTTKQDREPPTMERSSSLVANTNESSLSVRNASREIELTNISKGDDVDENKEDEFSRSARVLARQYMLKVAALGCLVVGAGCIILAMNLREQSRPPRRRWTVANRR